MDVIIDGTDLASYLEQDFSENLELKAELANGIVSELPYGVPLSAPFPTRVKAITLEVAARAVRNPGGYSSETTDDYTYRLPTETRLAGVYLTAAEREELLGFGSILPRGSFYTVGFVSPLDVE